MLIILASRKMKKWKKKKKKKKQLKDECPKLTYQSFIMNFHAFLLLAIIFPICYWYKKLQISALVFPCKPLLSPNQTLRLSTILTT